MITSTTETKQNEMKTIKTNKKARIEVPEGEIKNVVAVQLVEFVINFFGHEESFILDTKIMDDGRQIVVDGNGFIKSGYEVAA